MGAAPHRSFHFATGRRIALVSFGVLRGGRLQLRRRLGRHRQGYWNALGRHYRDSHGHPAYNSGPHGVTVQATARRRNRHTTCWYRAGIRAEFEEARCQDNLAKPGGRLLAHVKRSYERCTSVPRAFTKVYAKKAGDNIIMFI